MRQLTDTEMKTMLSKLANYTGPSLKQLLQELPAEDSSNKAAERNVFRVQASRVYYLKLSLANLAVSIGREKLLSLGTCSRFLLSP
jgi:60S ribosome subunit biogenesis protein NIP7